MNWKPSCEMADRNGELGGLRISTLQEAVYIGTSRFVAALEPDRGEELWRTRLSHGGGTAKVVTLVLKGDRIYAGCGGYVYCLDKSTGRILWESGLPSMGHHAVMIAMEGADAISSPGAAAGAAATAAAAAAATAPGTI